MHVFLNCILQGFIEMFGCNRHSLLNPRENKHGQNKKVKVRQKCVWLWCASRKVLAKLSPHCASSTRTLHENSASQKSSLSGFGSCCSGNLHATEKQPMRTAHSCLHDTFLHGGLITRSQKRTTTRLLSCTLWVHPSNPYSSNRMLGGSSILSNRRNAFKRCV
mmetsp:Transcript_4346/g.16375  ORF Transcript_4346/g.16375 Transcript_4346/m.16375 type:complete len:163 (+) Transcript_4346:1430-1918(+)